eukprot:TRINITY_DN100964_c0_g1_i1.p1 TRINITY_DN100964_c0_g1~~TRINITY_DN100964_c0_g1_i1.p1  ORF type:complete len:251 (-),score=62.76 TRINITY_DN100964_c0_g1_i1:65-817(-)
MLEPGSAEAAADSASSAKDAVADGDAPEQAEGGAVASASSADPQAASVSPKHELQHSWALWVHQRPGSQKNGAWGDSQRMVHEFGSAEDFWCMYRHAYPPSKLENADYSLFKHGVSPAWEDPTFKNGGRWVVKLEKVKAQSLDDLWLSLSLALIGEAFYDQGGDLVCGAIVSVRSRASKIALWLSAAKDEKKVMAIGKEYRQVLSRTPGLQELATKELTFEDFKKQQHTFVVASSRPHNASSSETAGVFQ